MGLELDTTLPFSELKVKLENGDFPVKVTREMATLQATKLTLADMDNFMGYGGGSSSLLDLAILMKPARVEGLRAIKTSLGC